MGVGLAFGVAAPAFAQDTLELVAGDQVLSVGPEGASIDAVDTRSPQEVFTADFLGCVGDIGVGDAVTGVLENVLDEEEVTESDETPLNPVDEGSIVESRVFDCEATPPL
ncbi:MAG: hypothetical protein M3464_21965 [Chloroflexota bacterium]|nr:hypothetical protein [Chloroflexota bacterium]